MSYSLAKRKPRQNQQVFTPLIYKTLPIDILYKMVLFWRLGTYLFNKYKKKTYDEAIFSRYGALKRRILQTRTCLSRNVSKSWQCTHSLKTSLILPKKNGTEKHFAIQWLSTSPNSTFSFKFYVQTPFVSIFITPHLGKGHIRTVNRHSGPDGVCYGQFI